MKFSLAFSDNGVDMMKSECINSLKLFTVNKRISISLTLGGIAGKTE